MATPAGNLASDRGGVRFEAWQAWAKHGDVTGMAPRFAPLPTDLASAHALILVERAARLEAEAIAAQAQATAARALAVNTSTEAFIAHMKLEIEKLRRALHGHRSERTARLLEQMELQLEELETAATEDELAAKKAAAKTQTVKSFQRKRPGRKPFPDHLPRERVVIPRRPAAPVAVRRSCRSWARTSPRRWR